jgi:hypothetical protein
MSEESLRHQAERAEALAAQTIDPEVKQTLLDAAKEYRRQIEANRQGSERGIQKASPAG